MVDVERIRSLCRSREISQKELAQTVGVTPQFITNILARKVLPSLDVLYRIAAALCVEPRELLISTLPEGDRRQGPELVSVCFVLNEGGDVMNQVQVRKPDVVTFFNVNTGADYNKLREQMHAAVEEALAKLVRPIIQPAGSGGA